MSVKKEAEGKNTADETGFIKWFSELNKDSGKIAGGKGANLAEIYNLGVQVPPGFVITAQAYNYFIKNAKIDDKIRALLGEISYENTKDLDEKTKKIRTLIETAEIPKKMEEEILESYEILGTEKGEVIETGASHLLKRMPKEIFVAVRSSATTEDLAEASFAGQQETFVNVKGKKNLITSIKKCFSSLFTPRATYYRNKKGFKYEGTSLAVVIQKMVDSDKSGVVFSKDPSMKRDDVIVESVWGLGEGIVSGEITPDHYVVSRDLRIIEKKIEEKKIAITRNSAGGQEIVKLKEERSKQQVLKDHEITKLAEISLELEQHYKKPQDLEFAIENGEIYIVQTRPITTLEKRFSSGEVKTIKGEVVLSGLAASPGIGVGKVKIVHGMADLEKVIKGDILVTEMTNPDMVVTMQKCAAIITDEGGLTAHAAIVSREMGIPAVVGTGTATKKLQEGEIITVDGFTGKIYSGKVSESSQKEIRPVTKRTRTQLKVILDLPNFAERASKTGIKKVGLARLEGTIAESGRHPNYFINNKKIKDYEEIIYNGIKKISEHFDDIWVRTSDIRSDEFKDLKGAPEQLEANPMLGMHGIRFSLKHPEILKAELNAMKRVAEEGKGKGKVIGVMFPQVISVDEVKKSKEFISEIGFTGAKVGIMVETPAAVQVIKEICNEGIDFISFGTNDLTQYILAIDRGNQEVQDLYDEMNPAVLYQLEFVIRVCKREGVETSICGQAASKKEMVQFLIEKGIDSISVNADVAADIADYISELESGKSPEIEPEQEPEPRHEHHKEESNKEERHREERNKEDYYREKNKPVSKKEKEKEEEIAEIAEALKEEGGDDLPIIPGTRDEKSKDEEELLDIL